MSFPDLRLAFHVGREEGSGLPKKRALQSGFFACLAMIFLQKLLRDLASEGGGDLLVRCRIAFAAAPKAIRVVRVILFQQIVARGPASHRRHGRSAARKLKAREPHFVMLVRPISRLLELEARQRDDSRRAYKRLRRSSSLKTKQLAAGGPREGLGTHALLK